MTTENDSSNKQKLDELCSWILLHLDEPIDIQRLMEVSGMSHFELHAVFRAYLRTSPVQWIRRARESAAPPSETAPGLFSKFAS